LIDNNNTNEKKIKRKKRHNQHTHIYTLNQKGMSQDEPKKLDNASLLDKFAVDNFMNRPSGELPWGLFNPQTEGKLTWNCGNDAQGQIVEVYSYKDASTGQNEKRTNILKDMDEATYHKTELENNGWRKLVPPKIELTMPDEKGVERPLTRAQRRYLERQIKRGYDVTNPDSSNPHKRASAPARR